MPEQKNSELTVLIPRPPITALVFEGGGIKGLVYAGALEALEKNELLKDLKWVAGSSAGAMTALMVALGYTHDKVKQELKNVDFSQFKDHAPSWFGVIGRTINGIRNLFGIKRGYYRGEQLYQWVKKIVSENLGNEMATFDDLHRKVIEKDSKFKDLFVTTTNLNTQKTKIFSYEKRAKAPIADVVLASMSIPLFFQARYMDHDYRINWEPTRKEIKLGTLVPYVDGGFLDNDPIGIFQGRQYWPPGYFSLIEDELINPSTLNIRVDSSKEINALWGKSNNPIINFFTWVKNLFNTARSDNDKSCKYGQITISIPDCDISTTAFALTDEQKTKLEVSGRKTTLTFIKDEIIDAAYASKTFVNIHHLESSYKSKQTNKQTLEMLAERDENDQHRLNTLSIECTAMEKAIKAYYDALLTTSATKQEASQELPMDNLNLKVAAPLASGGQYVGLFLRPPTQFRRRPTTKKLTTAEVSNKSNNLAHNSLTN